MSVKSNSGWDNHQGINFLLYHKILISLSFDDFYSIVWIEHYGEMTINFERYKLQGHYLIFLCPEEILEVSGYVECNVITIPTNFEMIESIDFVRAFGNVEKCFQLDEMTFLKISLLFSELRPIIGDNANAEELQQKLSDIFRICPIRKKSSNENELMLVYNFISLVHKHYKMHHDMSFYSKNLVTSPKQITEKFHLLDIIPPYEFIKKRILVEAKRQFLYTDKAAKTVCFDIGFNDPAYFARFFKKNTGMTSRAFKEQYKTD